MSDQDISAMTRQTPLGRRTFWIACAVAISFATVSVSRLIHDWVALAGGFVDDILHVLFVAQILLSPLNLAAVLVLLWFLGTSVGTSSRRAAVLAVVWTAVGLGAMGFVGAFPATVQEIANSDAARRITPDTYRELMAPVGELPSDPISRDALLSQFDWSRFQDYTWTTITIREALSIAIISIATAGSIPLVNRFLPSARAFASPIALVVLMLVYLRFVMPWAAILDYDIFIGDRVLGGVAANIFLTGIGDSIAQIVFVCYLLTIIGLAVQWNPALKLDRPTR